MRIAEVFYSIQGEGKLAGTPSMFVRASGCNLRCSWCDTPYASWNPEGKNQTVGQIVEQIQRYPAAHVVITGGEPMIMPDIAELCDALHGTHHVTIETAATVYTPLKLHLASLSPKLANSTPLQRDGGRFAATHERLRINMGVIQQFIDESPDFQLKFVVTAEEDLNEIDRIVGGLRGVTPADVLLMPEGIDAPTLASRAAWIVEICKQRGFRYCPRLHVQLYGNRRGT